MMLFNVLYDIFVILFIAAISAAFSVMLNFALGKPSANAQSYDGNNDEVINPHAILFPYSFFLAYRRLKKHFTKEEISEIVAQWINGRTFISDYADRLNELQYKREVIIKGREFFTYEHSIGMCIYCTNFWLSLIFALIAFLSLNFLVIPAFFIFLCTPVFSHLIIKKL